jgi:hypothetical protein
MVLLLAEHTMAVRFFWRPALSVFSKSVTIHRGVALFSFLRFSAQAAKELKVTGKVHSLHNLRDVLRKFSYRSTPKFQNHPSAGQMLLFRVHWGMAYATDSYLSTLRVHCEVGFGVVGVLCDWKKQKKSAIQYGVVGFSVWREME